MKQDLQMDYQYLADHIGTYLEKEVFFEVFHPDDIKTTLKISNLSADQFITLLEQSSPTIKAKDLYTYIRKANVHINNKEEIVAILESVKKYMKFNIFDGIIDAIKQMESGVHDSTEHIANLQERLNALKSPLQHIHQQPQILAKIERYKNYYRITEFEDVYGFLDDLSLNGNQQMLSKACEEGLWRKKAQYGRNILHEACIRGNIRLVKAFVELECNIESTNDHGWTALFYAANWGQPEVYNYLLEIGANEDAKDNRGQTASSFLRQSKKKKKKIVKRNITNYG